MDLLGGYSSGGDADSPASSPGMQSLRSTPVAELEAQKPVDEQPAICRSAATRSGGPATASRPCQPKSGNPCRSSAACQAHWATACQGVQGPTRRQGLDRER